MNNIGLNCNYLIVFIIVNHALYRASNAEILNNTALLLFGHILKQLYAWFKILAQI